MITRKQFLGMGAAAVGLSSGASRRRPNILFAISDDQSWLHTSAAGDPVVKTPTFDRIAQTGVRFTHAFCSSPSCTPSRGAVLTGQHFWRLEEGGNLWSSLPKKLDTYPDLLERAGYHVGLTGKGWGPGRFEVGGYTRNPAGQPYKHFSAFLDQRPKDAPFCFWFGSTDPHRPYEPGSGARSGMKMEDVRVPAGLPDTPEVRSDILDYCFEIRRFDTHLGEILDRIAQDGELENTLVVVTSDNGMPFPRAKTNLYDSGTRMPLAISWPAAIPGGRVIDDFVSHCDYAPTFLEAAGLKPPRGATGRSLLPMLTSKRSGHVEPARDHVITGRERHTRMREGGVGYPMRALRTRDFLYIRNFEPGRWPAGDPPHFGDIDNGPSKEAVIVERTAARHFELACGKRPSEELYDLKTDPDQQRNVASEARYQQTAARLSKQLMNELRKAGDPRATGAPVIWDTSPYYGGAGPQRRNEGK